MYFILQHYKAILKHGSLRNMIIRRNIQSYWNFLVTFLQDITIALVCKKCIFILLLSLPLGSSWKSCKAHVSPNRFWPYKDRSKPVQFPILIGTAKIVISWVFNWRHRFYEYIYDQTFYFKFCFLLVLLSNLIVIG